MCILVSYPGRKINLANPVPHFCFNSENPILKEDIEASLNNGGTFIELMHLF